MKEIEITQRVRRMIRAAGGINFCDTGRPSVDPGWWVIKVDEDVLASLTKQAFPGEDYSDTIERLLAEKAGHVN